jgi:glutamine amidotransferase
LDAIVVPGVGAFAHCAENLRATGLWNPVREWALSGRPYLGICLGYQLLFESSEESPGVEGLGVLKGRVVRFSDAALKVPHMGWNTLSKTSGPLYNGLSGDVSMYFVHSYYPVPADSSLVSAWSDYGVSFAAGVSSGVLHAVQFHPEKSQSAGLALLRNFLSTL